MSYQSLKEIERDDEMSNNMEKLMSKTCLWGENLKKYIKLVLISLFDGITLPENERIRRARQTLAVDRVI